MDIKDYPFLNDTSLWRISDTNIKYVKHFITVLRIKGLRISSVNNYTHNLVLFFRGLNLNDALTATKEEILSTILAFEETHKSDNTVSHYIITVKMFYKEYKTRDEVNKLIPYSRQRAINRKESGDYITLDDVLKMRKYAESQGDIRGMALIMMLFGTGARISELLDANIGDVEIKQFNGVLTVNGKTGKRKIPFVAGLPELVTWLNAHPDRRNEQAIFVSYNTRGNVVQRLSVQRAEGYIHKLKVNVGIPDSVSCTPHAFRHLLATTMAKKLTLREMDRLFGWSDSSHTVLTYLHTSDKDLEASILETNGIKAQEEEKKETMFIQCPSCNAILPPNSVQCPKCRMILDAALAVQLSNITDDSMKRELLQTYLEK